MIVIADTSPISYLILVDEAELLPELYGQILVPFAVFQELTSPEAPSKVRNWFLEKPDWFEVRTITTGVPDGLSAILDKGESEAIQMATELHADLILLDELAGRRVAKNIGLRVIGLIGVLAAASRRGLVDANVVASKLEQTNFFISADLIEFLRNSTTDL